MRNRIINAAAKALEEEGPAVSLKTSPYGIAVGDGTWAEEALLQTLWIAGRFGSPNSPTSSSSVSLR
jgi:hypothetical protein